MKRALGWALLTSAFLTPQTSAQSFDVTKVADGVYAGIGKPGVYSNGAFIVNREDVLVVDTHLRPSWARDLIAEIRKVTNNPVRYVVNTHWHGDHTQGNQVYLSTFGPNVEYLAQHNTREDIIHKAIPSVQQDLNRDVPGRIAALTRIQSSGKDEDGKPLTPERQAQISKELTDAWSYLDELKQIQITLPTITFERSLALHKPDRTIQVLYFGKGHTRGDVIVYLPREKIVVTGDLLTNGIPFMRDAYPVEWVDTLKALRSVDWDFAIPGHAGVQQGKSKLVKLISYMQDMLAAVRAVVGKGMTLQQAKKTIDLNRHAADFPNFSGGNEAAIERTWAELTGKIQE